MSFNSTHQRYTIVIKEIDIDATLPRYTGHKPLLVDPLSYGQLWLDINSNADLDGSFWYVRNIQYL